MNRLDSIVLITLVIVTDIVLPFVSRLQLITVLLLGSCNPQINFLLILLNIHIIYYPLVMLQHFDYNNQYYVMQQSLPYLLVIYLSFLQIFNFQKINHFPGMLEICRKDLLARNLIRMLKLFPKDYNIFPKTWCLPSE